MNFRSGSLKTNIVKRIEFSNGERVSAIRREELYKKILLMHSRSPLSGTENQGRIKERSSYYPQEPNKRPQTAGQKMRACLSHNALTLLTVSGVIGGVILGIVLRSTREHWTPREIMYINYLGDLFLRMLKSLILPLIISSLISAIGSLDLSLSGKIGARAIGYYMVTTICAVILGQFSAQKA